MMEFAVSQYRYGQSIKDIEKALRLLSNKSLLLGVAREGRTSPENEKSHLTNSEIAFITEYGAPEVNIPARPFLFPTLRDNLDLIKDNLKLAASYAMAGMSNEVDKVLHALGFTLLNSMKNRIIASIPPPLSKKTLNKWITLSSGTRRQRKDYGTTPLIVSHDFIDSLDYFVETH